MVWKFPNWNLGSDQNQFLAKDKIGISNRFHRQNRIKQSGNGTDFYTKNHIVLENPKNLQYLDVYIQMEQLTYTMALYILITISIGVYTSLVLINVKFAKFIFSREVLPKNYISLKEWYLDAGYKILIFISVFLSILVLSSFIGFLWKIA